MFEFGFWPEASRITNFQGASSSVIFSADSWKREYPGDPKRGGKKEDTANFVLLLQEMRAAFGTKYGITMAIAPDYWYLR